MHMTSQWRWLYHADDEQLLIKLAEGLVHPAPFKASRLVPLKPMDEPFSLEDATNFQTLFDQLEASDLVNPQIAFTAALNHTIYQRFGRPQMPQSWYFQTAEEHYVSDATTLTVGTLVRLNSGLAESVCAVVSSDGEFAECMVLAESFPLSDIKTLPQYDVIKVMFNRIQPLNAQQKPSTSYLRHA